MYGDPTAPSAPFAFPSALRLRAPRSALRSALSIVIPNSIGSIGMAIPRLSVYPFLVLTYVTLFVSGRPGVCRIILA